MTLNLPSAPQVLWSARRRFLAGLPIFLILMGVLFSISLGSSLAWNNQPTDQSMEAISHNTGVSMKPVAGSLSCPAAGPRAAGLCQVASRQHAYKVKQRVVMLSLVQPSTGQRQQAHVIIRSPQGFVGKAPAIVFMHGAGYGSAFNSFVDVATDLASAGFVTAVLDKPVWSTNDLTRDFPGSAHAYDQVINYLRSQPTVNADKIGIYATSESAWISPYLLQEDKRVAFQVLLSPMLFSPRLTLGFFVAQDFSIVGANPGYQGIVRRLFTADLAAFGLNDVDIDPLTAQSLSIPTFLAYGAKDVMTSQVSGATRVMQLARQAGNDNFVIRSYPLANHVLDVGNQSDGTMVDGYLDDVVDWTAGIVKGYQQTAPKVAGSDIYQSIGLPTDIKPSKRLTFYGSILHVLMALALLVSTVFSGVVVVRKAWARLRGRRFNLGLVKGLRRALLLISIATIACLSLFSAGLAQVIIRVINLVWGAAPEPAGMIYWSWYAIQIVTAVVVWAWARIFTALIEEGMERGWFRHLRRLVHPRRTQAERAARRQGLTSGVGAALATADQGLSSSRRASQAASRGQDQEPDRLGRADSSAVVRPSSAAATRLRQPIVASTRLGLAYFVCVTVCMILVLLVFAFWGLFLY